MSISKKLLCICLVLLFTSSIAQLRSVDQFRFIENKGLWHPEALYASPIPDGSIILGKTGVYYHFFDGQKEKELLEKAHHGIHDEDVIANHTFKMNFLKGNLNAIVIPSDSLIEVRNYLKGNDPSKWHQNIHAFEKITYKSIYPGIDFTIQEKNKTVKYEFVVAPHAKPNAIQLLYEGVEKIYIQNKQLIIQTTLGNVIDDAPFAYQQIGDQRIEVKCQYALRGNVLSYKLGKYNKDYPLVIDPRLIFSTSSGSLADNWGNTACHDHRGNLYTGGTLFETSSGNFGTPFPNGFPTSLGAVQNTFQGGDTDMAIMKFDSSGTFLHYATIIGGNDAEIPTSTVVNDNNELYILGTTASSDFPVTAGAFDTQFEGNTSTISWFVNGALVGTGPTFTSTTLNDNDEVYAEENSGYTCESNKQKESNRIVMKTPASPQVKITSTNSSFCTGDALSFTATVTNGTSPSFEWFVNGIAAGTNSPTFNYATPTNNDSIRVVITDVSCNPATATDTSDYIILNEATGGTPLVSISSDHLPLCSGERYVFKSSVTAQGSSDTYSWKRNGTQIGTLDSLVVTNLSNNDTIYLDYTSSNTCLATQTVQSNRLIVNNTASPQPLSITLTPEPYSDCDSAITVTANLTNAGSAPFLQWVLAGRFLVASGNVTSFTYQKAFGSVNQLDVTVFSSSGCTVPNSITSTPFVAPSVDSRNSDFTITSSSDTICSNSPITFTANTEGLNSQNYDPVGGYSFKKGTDIVVIHLNANGTAILNATYVGGIGNDGILEMLGGLSNNYGDELRGDINLDSTGNVYVASVSASHDFPVVNAAQPIFGGGQTDAVVFKMNPSLSTMLFSTYLGGNESDASYSIQTNDAHDVFVGGGTASANFPTTGGALQTTIQGGVDGFVTRLTPSGNTITNSTLLGTPQFDQVYFVQLDTNSNAYALGQTKGSYPVLNSKYKNPRSGLFLQKISPDLSTSIYSTVLGDLDSLDPIIPNISPTAFLINECENIFISGWGGAVNNNLLRNTIGNITYTARPYNGGFTFNMPLTPNAFQSTTDGSDFYLMVLLKGADSLIYATYFGGPQSEEHVDGGTSRFDFKGIVYQSVCSGCQGFTDFPTFPDDGSQATYPKRNGSDNCNNGVFKYDLATLEAEFEHDEFCAPNTITFINLTDGGIDFLWDFGDGNGDFTLLPDTVRHTYSQPGTYQVTLIATDLTTCIGKDTVTKEVIVPEYFTANHQYDTICVGETKNLALLDFDPAFTYTWDTTLYLSDRNIYNPNFTAGNDYQYLITVIDTNGCEKVDTFSIEVRPIVTANFELLSNCIFQKVHLINTSTNATDYEWRIGSETINTTKKDTLAFVLDPGTYVVNLRAANDSTCNKSDFADSKVITVLDSLVTAGDTLMCRFETAHPRVIYGNNPNWEASPSLSCLNCPNPLATPLTTTTYTVSVKNDTCVDTQEVIVSIIPDSLPIAIIEVDPPRCVTDTVYFDGLIERNDCECCEEIKSWNWNFDDGTTSTEAKPKRKFESEGTYTITLEIIARDTVQTTTTINLLPADSCLKNIYIPNAFTPNGDGENDILFVRAINIVQLEFRLFNRWGEEIFLTKNKAHGWNGVYKGAIMSPQVFTYTCKATFWDGEEFYQEGNVTLLE